MLVPYCIGSLIVVMASLSLLLFLTSLFSAVGSTLQGAVRGMVGMASEPYCLLNATAVSMALVLMFSDMCGLKMVGALFIVTYKFPFISNQ